MTDEAIDLDELERLERDARVRDLEDKVTALGHELAEKIQAVHQLTEADDAEHALNESLIRDLEVERARVRELEEALKTIERSGATGGAICAKRTDEHGCMWCRGSYTPCPVAIAARVLQTGLSPTPTIGAPYQGSGEAKGRAEEAERLREARLAAGHLMGWLEWMAREGGPVESAEWDSKLAIARSLEALLSDEGG